MAIALLLISGMIQKRVDVNGEPTPPVLSMMYYLVMYQQRETCMTSVSENSVCIHITIPDLGFYLTDTSGKTLYFFTKDTRVRVPVPVPASVYAGVQCRFGNSSVRFESI